MTETTYFCNQIAAEFGVSQKVAYNVITLLNEGATIPFIARYRKEMTNTMDEKTIADINKRIKQLAELDKRKEFVLKSIAEQEKLTPELEEQIKNASTMQDLEDIYLPYKPKRRTKAEIARQKGLEPLAKLIMSQHSDDVDGMAKRFVNKEKNVDSIEDAIKGACDIMAEWVSENISGRNAIRKMYRKDGIICSTVIKGKEEEAKTYLQYFDWKEPVDKAPSHRILALFRAEEEGLLKVKLNVNKDDVLQALDNIFVKADNASTDLVQDAIDDAWARLLEPSLETEMRAYYKEKADETAVKVFAENLRQLLLAAPLGQKRVLALDPGFRT